MASRNLGTLTIDLIAKTAGFTQGMTAAERSSEKWRRQVERDMAAARKTVNRSMVAMAAATVAATAAIAAMTSAGIKNVAEQNRLARSIDATYDSVTALRDAFDDNGINNFEASINRLNRRLGAAELGRGAALNTIKELNLELSELASVDADERIAIIADRISEVATSSQMAARFAQDLGFEQREAAQFFLQGGDAVRQYRDYIVELGLSLSDIEADQIEAASRAMGTLGDLTSVLQQRLAVGLSPLIIQMSEDFDQLARSTNGFRGEIDAAIESTFSAIGFVADAVAGFGRVVDVTGSAIAIQFLAWELGVLTVGKAIYNGPINALNAYIETLNKIPGVTIDALGMSETGQRLEERAEIVYAAIQAGAADVQETLMKPLPSTFLDDFLENARDRAQAATEAVSDLRDQVSGSGGGSGVGAEIDEIAKEITALERAAKVWGMSADEVKLYDLTVQGATDSQLMQARALQETVAGFEEAKANQEAYLSLVQDLRTDEEKLTDQLYERLAVLDKISDATDQDYSRAAGAAFSGAPDFAGLAPEVGGAFGELNKIASAESELQGWYDKQLQMLDQFRSERADLTEQWDAQEEQLKQEHEDRLSEIEQARKIAQLASTEEVFGTLADTAKEFAGEQSGIYRAMFAVEKAAALARSVVAIQAGMAQAAANPFPQNLAAIASVASATAGIVSAIKSTSIDGQAHDGIMSVPADGTWNLKKGERVTTAETSAKLDATLDRINQNQGGRGVARVEIINQGGVPLQGDAQMLDDETMRIILTAVDNRDRENMHAGRGKWREAQQKYGWSVKGAIG